MGSYLSIVNDTNVEWRCRRGPDEKALKIAGVVVSVLGSVAAIVGTMGAAAPVVASLSASGVVSVLGVSTSALATITGAAASASGVLTVSSTASGFAVALAKGVNDHLVGKGFNTLAPGTSHRYGKMALSLWQQGTCVRTYVMNEYSVRTETLYMRPIFSGSTVGSNRDHSIKYWIAKNGVQTSDVVAKKPSDGNGLATRNLESGEVIIVHESEANSTTVSERDYHEGDVIYFLP